jgi:LPXTG-motif cell wall-anchored protein
MQGKVMSTIMAIGDYRLNASSKTVMYFGESAAGKPVALKSWFYPGDNYGNRFIYPKVKAQALAAETNQPVPSYTAADVNKDTPVQVQTPAKSEVAYSPQVFQDIDAKDTAGADGEAVTSASKSGALPKTGSPLAGYATTGFALLVAAWLFRRARIATIAN